jgi:hypothetical protein
MVMHEHRTRLLRRAMPVLAPAIRIEELQTGDRVTIADTKRNELSGFIQIVEDAKGRRMIIKAFGTDVVLAKWIPSRVDPGDGKWDGRYKLIDFVEPIPGL